MANLAPLSGKNGFINRVVGASTPITAEACGDTTQLPGGRYVYPAKQVYQITAAAHQLLDPNVAVVVKNSTVVVKTTDYKLVPLIGAVVFYAPLGGTPSITIDGSYIAAATGSDVIPVDNVNNWELGLTANEIPMPKYGIDMIPQEPGQFAGTFAFDNYDSSDRIDLFTEMLLQKPQIFELYVDVASKRRWRIYGRMGGMPITAPSAGPAMGRITGGMLVMPGYTNV
jgi:hypothetical protein